jgi:hypothetical protein
MVNLIPIGNIREPARSIINNLIASGGGGGGGTTATPNSVLGYYTPEMFGAVGNNPSTDDWAGLQAAFDAATSAGGGTVFYNPEKAYYSSKTVSFDPSRIALIASSAALDFSLKTFINPASSPEKVLNGDFNFATNWSNSANTNNTITYGANTVSAPAAAGSVIGLYSEFGQQIAVTAGKTYRVILNVVSITTITVGINTSRDITISFRPSGIGAGGSGGTGRTAKNTDNEYTSSKTWVWDIVTPYTNPYLTIQSNCGFEIEKISIKELPDNTCLLVRTPASGNQRGHNYHDIHNVKIRGNTSYTDYVDGVVFDTPTDGFSSRLNTFGIDVSGGVGRGLVFQNRAYLMNFHSPRIVTSVASVDTLEGAADAGENIAFFGGNLGGGKVGIRNRGMAIRLYSTSIDFTKQFYVGTGDLEIHGGWNETNQHTSADALASDWADTQYRYDVTGGTVKLFGGYTQIDGSTTPQAEAIFRIAKNATVDLVNHNAYNLHTTSGAMAVGEGRISASFRGGVNKELEPVLMRNQGSRVLVGTEDNALTLNTWLASTSKQKQPDRRTINWHTNKTFTGTLARGSATIAVADTTGLVTGYTVEGTGIVAGSTIVSITTSTNIVLSNPVSGNGSQSLLAYQTSPYATATVGLDTTIFQTGLKSLKFTKSGIGATSLVGYIAIPVPAGRAVGGELYFKVPAIGGSASVQSLFIDAAFVALAGADSTDTPAISDTKQSITSQSFPITFSAGLDWTKVTWKSTRVDGSSAHDGYSPEWATHVLLSFNFANLPNGFEVYVDDLVASVM